MSNDESNHEDGDVEDNDVETDASNHDNSGEDSQDAQDGADQSELQRLNELTGKNFKSVEAAAKSIAEADKKFREQGSTKSNAGQTANTGFVSEEDYLIDNNPEVENIMPLLKSAAQSSGKTLAQEFRSNKQLQRLAEIESDESEQKVTNRKKISKPTRGAVNRGTGKSIDDMTSEEFATYQRTVMKGR